MKSIKIMGSILVSTVAGLFLLLISLSAQTEEIHFSSGIVGASQEQMGEAIKNVAFYRWNMGRIQEEAGEFIQKESLRGMIPQEGLGSWIAAAGHLKWELFRAEEALGASIVSVAMAENGRIQEALGSVIASNAQQGVAEARSVAQMALGQEISNNAQIQWASAMMAGAVQATLEGKVIEPLSPEILQRLRRTSGGFEAENTFRLALSLLETETGKAMMQVLPSQEALAVFSASTLQSGAGGLGGFAEFGFWALLGFVFIGWMAFKDYSMTMPPALEVEEEAAWLYKEAA